MKEKREKISIILAVIAIVLLVVFLVVIQMIQSKSQKKLLEESASSNTEAHISNSKVEDSMLVINEISGDGWIEIYNLSSSELDLSGYYFKINGKTVALGAGSQIERQGYMVVDYLNLMLDGENLIEFYSRTDDKIDSCLVSGLSAGSSYARTEDGGIGYSIMKSSKQASNNDSEQILSDVPQFSVPSGFYTDDFNLTISAKNGLKIYYTLDGTEPTTDSDLYSEPIKITDRSSEANKWSAISRLAMGSTYVPNDNIDKCTVIKAISVDPDGKKSEISSATYCIKVGEKKAYRDIPVISISTDSAKMFDYYEGIYPLGRTYEDMLAKEEKNDIYANYMQDWNIDASISFFGNDHYNTKNLVGKIKIHKDDAIDYIQKSFEFESEDESFVLSNGERDYTFKSRQGLANTILRDSNIAIPCEQYNVFVDGEYWGIYEYYESFDREYVARTLDIDESTIVTAVNGKTDKKADQAEFDKLYDFVINNSMVNAENYKKVCKMMDVESYARFMTANIYLANYDTKFIQYMWKDKAADNLWRWAIGEQNRTLEGDMLSTESIDTYLRPAVSKNKFFNSLIKNASFKEVFSKAMDDMCDKYFSEENVDAAVAEYTSKYSSAVIQNFARFSGIISADLYREEMNHIKGFIQNRKEYVKYYTDEYLSGKDILNTGGSIEEDDRDNT